jgi:hypothetical protein
MKTKRIVTLTAALILTTAAARASHLWEDANDWWVGHFAYDVQPAPKFTAYEMSMDLFGSFIADERGIEHLFETNIRHGHWGGGVGLNYFFTRELGIGGDINAADNGGSFIDMVDGNLIARFPIESAGLAPYLFGGGGRGMDPAWEWFGQAGVGLEWRFNRTTGIFSDGRYIWADSSDRLLLRAGVRVVF